MGMTHAPGCKEAPYDHSGPCKVASTPTGLTDLPPGQFAPQDTQGLDDSLATPITDATRAHREEMVDHPAHYGGEDDPYEAVKVIEAWGLPWHLGDAVKYIARHGKKDPAKTVEDLKKARWYIDRYISYLEKRTSA